VDKLVSLLKEKNLTLSCAESLTGGLFASSVTNISGASNVFKGGVVSYTNEIKENVLTVEKNVLDNDGAISNTCCMQMANNVKSIFNTDIGVSFTGNAGPKASENKPVGLVYIGISYLNKCDVYELNFNGDRISIKNQCISYAINKIYDIIIKDFK
jgi:nicotinamide-nucleotide amidase